MKTDFPRRARGRIGSIGLIGPIVLSLIVSLLCGCDYARMRDDEAVNLYEMELPEMPGGIVPLGGGIEPAFAEKTQEVKNPLQATPPSIESGRQAYLYFCIQCHGPGGEGFGTVGQSFAPLPTDLKSAYVQQQTDGELFIKIGKGFKRHPPLAYTVSVQDRWAILLYLRSLAPGKG